MCVIKLDATKRRDNEVIWGHDYSESAIFSSFHFFSRVPEHEATTGGFPSDCNHFFYACFLYVDSIEW